MKTVSLKLAAGMDRRLAATARKQGTSKSDLMRTALEAYFVAKRPGFLGSCLDLADDLIGCLEGPADLSTNKRRMKEFGK